MTRIINGTIGLLGRRIGDSTALGCHRLPEGIAGQQADACNSTIILGKVRQFCASPGGRGMTPLRYHGSRRLSAAIFMFAAATPAVALRAQDTGQISGIATDSAGAPIYSAQVTFSGSQPVFTDESGAFFFSRVSPGTRTITARRLGFAPLSVTVAVPDGNADIERPLAFTLARLPTFLETVLVETQRVRLIRVDSPDTTSASRKAKWRLLHYARPNRQGESTHACAAAAACPGDIGYANARWRRGSADARAHVRSTGLAQMRLRCRRENWI